MRRAAIGLVTFLALFGAESAAACDCAVEPNEKATLQGFDAAATARLIEVKNEDPQDGGATLVYRVLRVYKNSNIREGERLAIKDSPCSLPRNEGKRYGLRMYRNREERLESNSCALLSPRELRRAAERSGNARSPSSGCATAS